MFDNFEDYNGDYDVDNIDLEEEMYLRDIAEEEEEAARLAEESENEESSSDNSDETSDDTSDEVTETHNKRGRKPKPRTIKITESYLQKQLDLKMENKRDILVFGYNGIRYSGKVIYKIREDNYVFDVKEEGSTEKPTLKQMKLSKITK